jgi:hypothetical protein
MGVIVHIYNSSTQETEAERLGIGGQKEKRERPIASKKNTNIWIYVQGHRN